MKIFPKTMLVVVVVATIAGMVEAREPGEDTFRPRSVAELHKIQLDAARGRFEATRIAYEQYEVTANRLILASRRLVEAERDVAAVRAVRIAAARDHFTLLKQILKSEEAMTEVSRCSNVPDIEEIKAALLDAEFRFAVEAESSDDGKGPAPQALIESDHRKREALAKLGAVLEASDRQAESDLRSGKPLGEAWEAHGARFREARSAFEREFGGYPKLYSRPPTLEELEEARLKAK